MYRNPSAFRKALEDFFLSNAAKRFYWNTFNGFAGLLVVYLTGLKWEYSPIVIAILNMATKELNKKWQNRIWNRY